MSFNCIVKLSLTIYVPSTVFTRKSIVSRCSESQVLHCTIKWRNNSLLRILYISESHVDKCEVMLNLNLMRNCLKGTLSVFSSFNFLQTENTEISIGGSTLADARRTPSPEGSRFFRFNIQNFRNVTASGVHAPPTRSTPPYGKSWIRHWVSVLGKWPFVSDFDENR